MSDRKKKISIVLQTISAGIVIGTTASLNPASSDPVLGYITVSMFGAGAGQYIRARAYSGGE